MMKTNNTFSYIVTIYKLGLSNVLRVAAYKIGLKSGFFKLILSKKKHISGPFFLAQLSDKKILPCSKLHYFTIHEFDLDSTPDWFSNPWSTTAARADQYSHWSEIHDFSDSVGDIKIVWEPSRFDWAPKLAWQSRISKDGCNFVAQIEQWVCNWSENNPPNTGVNWKCGQEASLRALNMLLTAKILSEPYESPSDGLLEFFEIHLDRIIATTIYAKAQNNNHGTSEAVALYSIGTYLFQFGIKSQREKAKKAMDHGLKLLENRINHLIMKDGSFSQASTTYHRLMLDTVLLCELTRKQHGANKFSDQFYSRMRSATYWLYSMMDSLSGDTPNLGPNDGAFFGNIENYGYRDFRPTLKRALAVFCDEKLNIPEKDGMLDVYGFKDTELNPATRIVNSFFPDGGFARLNLNKDMGHLIFRYPKYTFRPAHCDGNHLDIWLKGRNLTMAGGSFSYNTTNRNHREYFASTKAHCTIRFDKHDQMRRLGRMLRGDWLNPDIMEFDGPGKMIKSKYTDYSGSWHYRSISIKDNMIIVQDEFGGFSNCVELRWRLAEDNWARGTNSIQSDNVTVSYKTDLPYDFSLEYESNSLHYLENIKIPVLKFVLEQPGCFETIFSIS